MERFLERFRKHGLYQVAAAYGVTAWLFAQAASIVLPAFAAPSWSMRIVIIGLVLGLPIVLAATSALALREKKRWAHYAIFAALGVVVMFSASELVFQWPIRLPLLVDERNTARSAVGNDESLAAAQNGRVEVVKFETRERAPDLQHLSGDITDAIVRTLTRSSVDSVSPDGRDLSGQAAPELRVTGSVDRQGDNFVVHTRVQDRKTGIVLNSAEATRPVALLAGFSDKIGLDVAGPLDCMLEDRRQSHRVMAPTVLALYLNACDAIVREGNMQRMLETTRRLVKAAPDLAIAHALYAIAQALSVENLDDSSPDTTAMRQAARNSAATALKLDPQTPKAYLAIAKSYPDGSAWIEREHNLLKARDIDPNLNPGRIAYIELLMQVGRTREAETIAQQLQESTDARILGGEQVMLVLMSGQLGDWDTVHELLDQMAQWNPEAARKVRWNLISYWEEPRIALKDLQTLGSKGIDPRNFACVEKLLVELPHRIATHRHGLPPLCDASPASQRLVMMVREGDIEGAYAIAASFHGLPQMGLFGGFFYGPTMKAFRADPRFIPLAKRLGLLDYWVMSGHWPDFCAERDLPYDCRKVARS